MQLQPPRPPSFSIDRRSHLNASNSSRGSRGLSKDSLRSSITPPKNIEPVINQVSQQLTQELEIVKDEANAKKNEIVKNITFVDSDNDGVITAEDNVLVTIVENTNGDRGEHGAIGAEGSTGRQGDRINESQHPTIREVIIPFKVLLEKVNGLDEILKKLNAGDTSFTEAKIFKVIMDNMIETMLFEMYQMNQRVIENIRNPRKYF